MLIRHDIAINKPSHLHKASAGFTLIEILIALFIFIILSMMVAVSLATVLKTQERIQARLKDFGQLQIALTLLERDIEQMINRPIIDARGQSQAAFLMIGNTIQFTRSGYLNPLAVQVRSSLQRVAYESRGMQLIRKTWQVLDQAPNSVPSERLILDNISAWQVHAVDTSQQYVSVWPNSLQQAQFMPVAIEIRFKWKNNMDIMRLIKVPG
jgi:general secretion pathway protein J